MLSVEIVLNGLEVLVLGCLRAKGILKRATRGMLLGWGLFLDSLFGLDGIGLGGGGIGG